MRNTLRERLEYEGYAIETAESEEMARALLHRLRFDLVLTDAPEIHNEEQLPPFIVLSTERSIDSAVEAVRHGAEDYLTKPIDMNRLLQSIHRTLDREPTSDSTPTHIRDGHVARRVARPSRPLSAPRPKWYACVN